MAVNSKAVGAGLAGLGTKEGMMIPRNFSNLTQEDLSGLMPQDELLKKKNFDKTPAVVRSQDHSKEQPAALTEGEYVFSIPAIIALGEGDMKRGLMMLDAIHNMLREQSIAYLDPKSIAAAGLGDKKNVG